MTLLEEGRAAWGEPEFLKHMEAVVMGMPNAASILARRREGYGPDVPMICPTR